MDYNRIKPCMKQKRIKIVDLARQIGKSRVVVSNYVNNHTQPSIETLFKIAEVLDTDPGDLLYSRTDITVKTHGKR